MEKKVKSKIPHYNFSLRNRKGQFYLVAAVVVVGIVLGSIAVINYSDKSNNVVVEELKKELEIETQNVLDYDETHTDQMRNFGQTYSDYRSEIEIYFIFGTESDMDAYRYFDGDETDFSSSVEVDSENDKILFTLDEEVYEFDLASGKNFYFIISQEIKGDSYVSTG